VNPGAATLDPVRASTLVLLFAGLSSSCASPPPGPAAGLPPDFALTVRSRGATNPHCDYEVTVDASGRVSYAITHFGRTVGNRRGEAEADAGTMRALWSAVAGSGIFDLPASLPPEEGKDDRGEVLFRVRAGGRRREVLADRAGTPGLDAILRAVYDAVPRRAWWVPGEPPP